MRPEYRHEPCKTALTRVRNMRFRWSLNPYMGCVHRCTFCFVRAFEKLADRPFDARYGTSIRVKTNLVGVLRAELAKKSWKREQVVVGTLVVITVGLFILSMFRLHRQMAAAKARYVAHARRLYEDAYAPLRDNPTTTTLEQQSSALSTAQSLDARAQSILTWPVDEGTLKFIAVVVTGVVTSVVVRGLFAALGF